MSLKNWLAKPNINQQNKNEEEEEEEEEENLEDNRPSLVLKKQQINSKEKIVSTTKDSFWKNMRKDQIDVLPKRNKPKIIKD